MRESSKKDEGALPDIGQQRLISPLKGRAPRDAFEEFHMRESKDETVVLLKQSSKQD